MKVIPKVKPNDKENYRMSLEEKEYKNYNYKKEDLKEKDQQEDERNVIL